MEQGEDRTRGSVIQQPLATEKYPDLIVRVRDVPAGSPSEMRGVAVLAWHSQHELQMQPRAVFVQRLLDSCEENVRVELLLVDDGISVGGAVITPDHDLHVGKCLSVQWLYVEPEYRNCGFARVVLRLLRSLATKAGYPCVAYTHRLAEGHYTIRYRRP